MECLSCHFSHSFLLKILFTVMGLLVITRNWKKRDTAARVSPSIVVGVRLPKCPCLQTVSLHKHPIYIHIISFRADVNC